MKKDAAARAFVICMILAAFTVGYFCGSVGQQRADAQSIGGFLEQAGKGGGPLATASQLGSAIVEMQDHVTGLQKNIDTLKKVQSTLTGK
jgi:hypothetical protein